MGIKKEKVSSHIDKLNNSYEMKHCWHAYYSHGEMVTPGGGIDTAIQTIDNNGDQCDAKLPAHWKICQTIHNGQGLISTLI